jgi:phosphoribosylformylglycinamidine (FGAM) synthase-like enzyme
MMLSESQERMLMVLRPEKEEEAEAIFVKWGLDFAIVGKTTDDLRFRVLHQGEEVANLPIKDLGDKAPEYDRPWVEAVKPAPLAAADIPQADVARRPAEADRLRQLSSRRWVYEQYDTLIQGNSLQLPGGDAGVVRVEGHATKALAFSSDVTPRYVEADPFEGGKQAVAECWRNITATGAEPLAATDNFNFGNPERPKSWASWSAP